MKDFLEKYDMVLLDDFLCDIKYATTDNFMGKIMYVDVPCALRRGTYKKLVKVQEELKIEGLQLKIWDAYRPYNVQKKMWDSVHDERYVSNPKINTYHPRGNAVDVTLCDLKGNELVMPTRYDSFSEKAERKNYYLCSEEVQENVIKLEKVMVKHGFVPLETEWWHFNDNDSYDVIYD